MMHDFSTHSLRPDRVVCNWCGIEMLVDNEEDTCPVCHKSGYLMDLEQEIER